MRSMCAGCGRPSSVCLCDAMPSPPLHLQTRLLILQHPHEVKHKLATVPVLARCVHPCHVVVGRRLHSENWPFPSLPTEQGHTLLLFPGPGATELHTFQETVNHTSPQEVCEAAVSEEAATRTLVVVDGTWEHAQEMVKASMPFLAPFITQVCLPFDIHAHGHGVSESELIIRKEPFGGCVSTMEAVARALAILEPQGHLLEPQLKQVLRKMVLLQASHYDSPKIRPKLQKGMSKQ